MKAEELACDSIYFPSSLCPSIVYAYSATRLVESSNVIGLIVGSNGDEVPVGRFSISLTSSSTRRPPSIQRGRSILLSEF